MKTGEFSYSTLASHLKPDIEGFFIHFIACRSHHVPPGKGISVRNCSKKALTWEAIF
jgi:hypothetical protein